jgi:hypothetical protein
MWFDTKSCIWSEPAVSTAQAKLAAPVEPMQGTGQTGAMELVPDQPLTISVTPN